MAGFKDFIMRGNVVDLAVAVIIGAAFGGIVDSMTKDIITPVIGMIGGQPDFSALKIGTICIGNFINALISFLIKAFVVYYTIVKPFSALMKMLSPPIVQKKSPIPSDVELLTEIRPHLTVLATRGHFNAIDSSECLFSSLVRRDLVFIITSVRSFSVLRNGRHLLLEWLKSRQHKWLDSICCESSN